MSRDDRTRATAGLILFVALAFLGSWCVAASLRVFDLTVSPATIGTRLFTTSLLYAVMMGWQPIVATWVVRRWVDPPDRLDLGLRPAPRGFSLAGGLGAITIAGAATLVALSVAGFGGLGASRLSGIAEEELANSVPSLGGLAGLGAAFLATLLLVWVQAFAEEIGWRGYFLPRVMQRFGRWRGLILHGGIWGLWYAPVLFFSSYGQLDIVGSVSRCAAFVVTCVLLGTLFGWLRLAAGSLVPVVITNTTLTLAAGLPYVVHGVDAGLRSAAFGTPGWLVLAVVIACLLMSRWKAVVQIPELVALPDSPPGMLVRVWLVLEGSERGPDRYLH